MAKEQKSARELAHLIRERMTNPVSIIHVSKDSISGWRVTVGAWNDDREAMRAGNEAQEIAAMLRRDYDLLEKEPKTADELVAMIHRLFVGKSVCPPTTRVNVFRENDDGDWNLATDFGQGPAYADCAHFIGNASLPLRAKYRLVD